MTEEDLGHPQVVVGTLNGDHIAIRVVGRMHAGADDYWDGNWLVTPIDVVVGGFRGTVFAGLRAEELRSFYEALSQVYESLQGEASLSSIEGWLTLQLGVDLAGHVKASGQVVDQPGIGNELSFKIEGLDQSDVPAIIAALDEVMTFFPVIGTP